MLSFIVAAPVCSPTAALYTRAAVYNLPQVVGTLVNRIETESASFT